MVLAHDDDLVTIDGLGHESVSGLLNGSDILPSCGQSLENLEPEVMMDLIRRSNIEIHKVLCGELPNLYRITNLVFMGAPTPKDLSPTGPNTDRSVVKVAMLSTKSQDWSG
jgi:hypothetical protein